MKVLKFEIVNSRKLSIYFSGVVPRTIETALPVTLFPGRFKNGPFKNREDDTRSLSQNYRAHRRPPPLAGYLKGVWAIRLDIRPIISDRIFLYVLSYKICLYFTINSYVEKGVCRR